MLVRKKKENLRKKKEITDGSAKGENLQTIRSWIRTIEQTTTSVSSRLSAVENRLSGGMKGPENSILKGLEGPIATLLLNAKKKNAGELARMLDGELSLLHNELIKQQQETCGLQEQLGAFEKTSSTITTELQAAQTAISEMKTAMEVRMKRPERHEPFVMHVGALEVPVEFTGLIGGLLAFIIAILVLIDQKPILLSPVFLFLVGFLLIGFALLKMVRTRSRTPLHPFSTMPVKAPSAQINPFFFFFNLGFLFR
jgi:hypothetical protein